ncbi:hypothetical protein NQZ79_g7662 [Umbelopsis isabellina]|nr:hypothetical protein NQZ79_g7662 [Umbelopsis isabellina]
MTQTIALAGAGGIGSHIVDAILQDGNFKLIVLSRGTNEKLTNRGVTVRTVDYSSVPSLTEALKGTDVVISCVFKLPPDSEVQHNLLRAAEANGVKRFIPSEFGQDVQKFEGGMDFVEFKRRFRKVLFEQDKIEYTCICTSTFMDYILPKNDRKYLGKEHTSPVDFETMNAIIPGDGNNPVTLTWADDVGRAIVWLLNDSRPWPKYAYVKGTVTSWNELLKWGEQAIGKKFEVQRIPMATLLKNAEVAKADSTNPMKIAMAEMQLFFASDDMMVLPDNADPSMFKGIDFVNAKDLIFEVYGQK